MSLGYLKVTLLNKLLSIFSILKEKLHKNKKFKKCASIISMSELKNYR